MRHALAALGLVVLSASPLAAQALGLDDFTWTFNGPSSAWGDVSSDVIHVTGPDGATCSNALAGFTTTAPFAGTVRAHLDWATLDECHYDWPVRVINGVVTKIAVSGDTSCFLDGACEVVFAVAAGDVFGLGVGSSDCGEGAGIADFTAFTFLPPDWLDAGGALDPRLELQVSGPAGMADFGNSLASVGDLDGDGLSDLAVTGSPGFPADQTVFARNGADGAQLWTSTGPLGFGDRLAPAGDVNADGVPDLAASLFVESTVRMLSGADGAVLWTWIWSGSDLDYYSIGLAAPADFDGDGALDVAVGSSKDSSLPVRLLSGATGVELGLLQPTPGDTEFGVTLAAPGDLNGDGQGDLLVGAKAGEPLVRVVSGADLSQLYVLQSPSPAFVAWNDMVPRGAGDWDGDGVPDIAVGDPLDLPSPATGGTGSVAIFTGVTGSLVSWLQAPAGVLRFGEALAGGVDVNGDGRSELAIAAPDVYGPLSQIGGTVRIVSGWEGGLLQEFTSSAKVHLGQALAWQHGASQPTLAVGVPAETKVGALRLYADLTGPGLPVLSMYGAMVSGSPWVLRVDHGLPGNVAFLVVGLSKALAPFKGGVIVPSPDLIVPVALDGAGVFETTATAPAGIATASIWLQAWMPNPAGPHGWSATRAQRSPLP